jgi:hypothetical protein
VVSPQLEHSIYREISVKSEDLKVVVKVLRMLILILFTVSLPRLCPPKRFNKKLTDDK